MPSDAIPNDTREIAMFVLSGVSDSVGNQPRLLQVRSLTRPLRFRSLDPTALRDPGTNLVSCDRVNAGCTGIALLRRPRFEPRHLLYGQSRILPSPA